MRLLFINPWIADFTAYHLWMSPLGLLYMASVLQRSGVQIAWIDCIGDHLALPARFRRSRPDGTRPLFSQEMEKPKALAMVPRHFKLYGLPREVFEAQLRQVGRVDGVLMTSSMTYWYPGVQRTIESVRRVLGRVPVVLGGVYATLCPEHARRTSGADEVVAGEGERELPQVMERVFGWPMEPPGPWETMPSADFRLLGKTEVFPLLTSRGCPFSCSYCASRLLSPSFRARPLEAVLEELTVLSGEFSARHIAFYDDALLWRSEERIKPLLRAVIEHRLDFCFHTPNGLHLPQLDGELARLMKQAGFQTIRLSLESTSSSFLARTASLHKQADLEQVVRLFERAGFARRQLEVYLLVGLPGQTAAEVEESLHTAARSGVRVRLAYFSPVPGTALWKQMVAEGRLAEDADPLLQNKVLFPYLWPDIGPDELERIKRLHRQVNLQASGG